MASDRSLARKPASIRRGLFVLVLVLVATFAPAEALAERSAGSRTGFVVVPAELAPQVSTAHGIEASAVLYLNRGGGQYAPGANDSRSNRSSLVDETSAVPGWEVADAEWSEVVDCISELFADYRLEVTDVDPGAVPHIEAVLSGSYDDFGPPRPDSPIGVSPFSPECSPIDNSIVFVFADDIGGDLRRVCEVTAQEVAHSLGLDHAYLCDDTMSYLLGCGDKSFQDVDAPCGESEARSCEGPGYDCGRDRQNSAQLLGDRLGRWDEPEPVAGACDAGGGSGAAGLVLASLALVAIRRRGCRRA